MKIDLFYNVTQMELWVTNILKSYFELIHNIGDGDLKYNPSTDGFKSNVLRIYLIFLMELICTKKIQILKF